MITVLVTGAGGGVGQGIIKAIKLINDLDVKVIAADMSPLAPGLYGGSEALLVPSASSNNYFDIISKICKENKINYYFPGTDVELLKAADFASELYKKCQTETAVCPKHVIKIADDKYLTYKFLVDNGFDAPMTQFPQDIDLNSLQYPVIIKPKVGCRSIGVYKVNNIQEAKAAIDSVDDPVIQEYLDGDEFTCTVVGVKNKISDVLCLKRDLRAGDTYRAFPEKNAVIENYVKALALKLGIYGSCNFQLRFVDGVPKLFEINSRSSGTTPFCAQLGFNPIEFYLKSRLDIPYQSNINYDAMVLRHWTEVVVSKSILNNSEMASIFKVEPLKLSSMV
ncbi:ATP-grasp domain-containing protein [Vibrio crassostreae]|uniref:ATP-grasp domain-containing protein n=1 Tax=Vibrio crassostreae TaxID=246167 RepID=UPI001B309B6E|nr:ATP-grasp domain-containing protein [Vibrio crassostreae]